MRVRRPWCAPAPSVGTADADARVERGVQDVGEQVEQHHEHRGDGHPRQDHRIVGALERVEEQQPEAGPAEDALDHDHPAEEHPGVDGDDGHERDQRVAQRVPADHLATRHALRPRGAHVVGVQHLEHAVALVATPRRHAREHEHRHRQHHVLDEVDDVALLPDRVLALHVEHVDAELLVQHDHHEQLQQEREEEVGHREAEVRERRRRVVEQRVLAHRADHADEERQHHREHQRGADEQQRVPGGLADHVGDRALGAERLTPVALHEVAQPVDVLGWARLVEVVLVLEVLQRLLRDAGTVAQVRQRITTRRDEREHHDRREEDDDHRGEEAPHDEGEHREFLAERSCATAAIPDGRAPVSRCRSSPRCSR